MKSITRSAYPICGIALSLLVAWAVFTAPEVAHGYAEPNTMGASGCGACHISVWNGSTWIMSDPPSGGECVDCHGAAENATPGPGYSSFEVSGPHGGYITTSRKCQTCHRVHVADADGVLLLPGATITATCEMCHDGTGGSGVYGVIEDRGLTAEGGHSCNSTSVVPGGDAATGGSRTVTFAGPGGTLTCTDCHSPHGADVVTAFLGERRRIRQGTPAPVSTRLLRRDPLGTSATVSEYGSDWCMTCHEGRMSGGVVANHPVESADSWPTLATRFIYRRLAVVNGPGPTGSTTIGALGGTAPYVPPADPDLQHRTGFVNTEGNRGYLMPLPRTTGANGQAGHAPLCQQCHEDSRDVGDLAADGTAQPVAFVSGYADGVTWDGSAWVPNPAANPQFQNFPHETTNRRLLVETEDDLCLNCHTADQLP